VSRASIAVGVLLAAILGVSIAVGAAVSETPPVVIAPNATVVTEPQGFNWELAALVLTGLGTTALAVATGALAYSTRSDVRATVRLANISQAALEAQVQPVLIDVVPEQYRDPGEDAVPYEPRHADGTKNVGAYRVDVRQMENGNFACSVPLRNAGAGLAFINDDPRLDHPSRDGDYIGRLTKQVVPPGEQTRAYFGPGVPLETPEDATLIVKVPYADASASSQASQSRTVWTEATIQKRGADWRVIRVSIRRDGDDEPFVVSAASI
jgi:hypothetical protein